MENKLHRRFNLMDGPILTYSIDARKDPIAEVYKLDVGYLTLWAGVAGGYTRKLHKTQRSAEAEAERQAIRYALNYFDRVELCHDID